MNDLITVRGYVATEVRLTVAHSGLPISSFRMCTTERRFDKETSGWVDGTTNWYSVSMFRQLATNAGASIRKGDRVIVTGRLRIRPWASADGRTGTSVEIDADTVGHDLMWGTANFKRTSADRTGIQPGIGESGTEDGAAHDRIPDGVDSETGELYGDAFATEGAPDRTGAGAEQTRAEGVSAEGTGAGGSGAGEREGLEQEAVPF